MLERKILNQDPSLDYPREFTAGTGDLVPTSTAGNEKGGEDAGEPDDEGSTSGAGPREQGGRGPQLAHDSNSRPTYSQHNVGRTVVANQGTQHVNLGGSDE